jgi:hypothetical protein
MFHILGENVIDRKSHNLRLIYHTLPKLFLNVFDLSNIERGHPAFNVKSAE